MTSHKLADCPALADLSLEIQQGPAPGFGVFLSHNGNLLDTWFSGYADLEQQILISEDTRFHVASLSKPFTAMAVLILADQGHVSLMDSVTRFIPELKVGQEVKVQHLLTHTSGLRDQWPLLELAGWRGNDTVTLEDATRIILRQHELNHMPGSHFRYSNSGYTLLAKIVEIVSGMSLRNFARDTIFDPLGMDDTDFMDQQGELIRNRARAYRHIETEGGDGRWENFSPSLYVPGPTSLCTSIADLAKWDQNFNSSVVGNRQLFDRMHASTNLPTPAGYGLFVIDRPEGRMAFHPGNDFGFHAYYARYLSHDVSIAILTNANHSGLGNLASNILNHFLDRSTGGAGSLNGHATQIPVSVSDAERYSGIYESDIGEIRQITYDGDMQMSWGGKYAIVPRGEDTFASTVNDDLYKFTESSDNCTAEMTIYSLGYKAVWRRLPESLTDISFDDLLGEYNVEELGCRISIEPGEGGFVVVFPKFQARVIHARHGIIFLSDGLWFRVVGDKRPVQKIRMSMPRALNVICTREE